MPPGWVRRRSRSPAPGLTARSRAGNTPCTRSWWEGPGFYATYMVCVGAAAAIVLIPRVPLQLVIISVQVFAGLILPSAIIFLQLLLNDRELLGERWVNRPWNNF